MRNITGFCAAFLVLVAGAMSSAMAAAPVALDPADAITPAARPALGGPLVERQLDVEMTVHGWVLCISQPTAETLFNARQQGPEAAAKAYADLKSSKSCGQFSELQVILRQPLHQAALGAGEQTGIYGASVNVSGTWANAFLVYGGVPAE